ncbi:MAG: HIT family hydrolase [Elusimicrobia bacterium CG03_land_8_20_14_0_80_50_18]|nr:MAG: HIT family hydrolase [Elusimicrobia bacterium CG03_land_8_20_14_0_80_50_18]PIX14861.1 MAG: HIT family hydrolase [Elusimicrobia bacterium CG_4_8_14_3_um_filter_50_9]
MKHLSAPWRDKYFDMKQSGCIFCKAAKAKKDAENLVVLRGAKCFMMLNLFPYTNAHVMVAPYRHTGDVTMLSAPEAAEMAVMVSKAVSAMKKLFHCEGFNIGVNQGAAAGAGFTAHTHTHVVGRWKGDTNFMTTLAATRVAPSSPQKIYRMLKKELA